MERRPHVEAENLSATERARASVPSGSEATPTRREAAGPAKLALVKKIVKPVFATTAFLFVVLAAWDLHSRWDGSSIVITWSPLGGALGCATLAMLLQLTAWRALIFRLTGKEMPRRAAAMLYLDSQMARYTPGKVGLLVVRIAGAKSVHVAPGVMGAALLIEVLSWCGVGSMVGGAVLGFTLRSTELASALSLSSLAIAAAATFALSILCSVDRRRYPQKVRTALGEVGQGPLVPLSVPFWHAMHYAAWIGCGALVARAVGAPWDVALLIGGLLCVALVAGFLALLAPAGAGVREAIVAIGSAPFLGASAGLAVGVLTRVVSLVSDVLLFSWFRHRARQTDKAG